MKEKWEIAGLENKSEEPPNAFEREAIDVKSTPKCIEMVRFGVAVMWREMRRLATKAETQLLELQEQKLYGNYVEFFLKLHASGVLDGVLKDEEPGVDQEESSEWSAEELAALTVEASKTLGVNLDLANSTMSIGENNGKKNSDN